MASIIVSTKDKSELNLLRSMLKKMGIASKILSEEEGEDIALGYLMSKADRTKTVSREKIMKKLMQ
jgi:hypothetical protein